MLLPLLGTIYGKVADLRNSLYDRGWFEARSLGARTISVGNLTTGGTGKTPLVIFISEFLANRGDSVCVLTRGYGRERPGKRVLVSDRDSVLADAQAGGDEPVEIARRLLSKAVVVADADRVAAARWVKNKFGVTAFVLDDAFQHRKAARDVDIVCIDATIPFGEQRMLPNGRLREPVRHLARADIIVLSVDEPPPYYETLRREIRRIAPDAAVFEMTREISRFVKLEDISSNKHDVEEITLPKHIFAFCGLGKPANFFRSLAKKGLKPVGTLAFPDHHRYSQRDVSDIENAAAGKDGAGLVTTVKDAVKLGNLKFELPCCVAEMEVEMDDPNGFTALL